MSFPARLLNNLEALWHARHERSLPYAHPDRLKQMQDRRLRRMVTHAYTTVPFYRETMNRLGLRPSDLQSVDDLDRLPIVTGAELAEHPQRFLSTKYSDQKTTVELDTTGTIGKYKRVQYDRRALLSSLAAGQRQRSVFKGLLGSSLGYRELDAIREGGTDELLRNYYCDHTWVPERLDITRRILPLEATFEHQVEVTNRFKPEVVYGFGSAIGSLYRRAWLEDVELHRPKLIVYGGDLMRPPDRNLIEDEFGVPVFSTYQAVEALRIGYQCEHRSGFHISVDQVVVRAVDDDGQDVEPGQPGKVIVSNLVNRATVLLNYEIGDLAILDPDPCSCGRTFPLIARIEGRVDDMLIDARGERCHESVVLSRLYGVEGVAMLRVVQNAIDDITIEVVPAKGVQWTGESEQALRTALRSCSPGMVSAQVRVNRVDEIQVGRAAKYRAIVRKHPLSMPQRNV